MHVCMLSGMKTGDVHVIIHVVLIYDVPAVFRRLVVERMCARIVLILLHVASVVSSSQRRVAHRRLVRHRIREFRRRLHRRTSHIVELISEARLPLHLLLLQLVVKFRMRVFAPSFVRTRTISTSVRPRRRRRRLRNGQTSALPGGVNNWNIHTIYVFAIWTLVKSTTTRVEPPRCTRRELFQSVDALSQRALRIFRHLTIFEKRTRSWCSARCCCWSCCHFCHRTRTCLSCLQRPYQLRRRIRIRQHHQRWHHSESRAD